ncbi:MAG: NAD kinase [Prevotellaceae bacterium]|jgi:NAD+ kinase|nr:NAD kinase [Prevotellaceae bacterium]
MKIILFGTQYKDFFDVFIEKIFNILQKNSVDFFVERSFFEQIKNKTYLEKIKPIDCINFSADMAISLGGDGTFLDTASKIGGKNIPVLGINAGRLGFLADVSETEIEAVLQDILDKKFRIEQRAVLQMSLSDGEIPTSPFALNEIAVLKQDTSAMLNINAWVDDDFVNAYKSDGLLIATPTGSTAYSMSVGGAILAPNSSNFIILPVASHSLTVRPLVIGDNCKIRLQTASRTGVYQISLDGRSFQISDKTKIFVQKAHYTIKSIQPANHSFFNTLRTKLMWGADIREN